MDVQTRIEPMASLVALVQCLARLEGEEGYVADAFLRAHDVIAENRFLAARDGATARLIDPVEARRVPLEELVDELIASCRPHAQDLGCEAELDGLLDLCASGGGASEQLRIADTLPTLGSLVGRLAEEFREARPASRSQTFG
jgi:carboxylate-amine ligase